MLNIGVDAWQANSAVLGAVRHDSTKVHDLIALFGYQRASRVSIARVNPWGKRGNVNPNQEEPSKLTNYPVLLQRRYVSGGELV